MAERTLAEAVAELRLSDRKFASDFTLIRQRLLGAIHQVEQDARITVLFNVDDDQIVETFSELEQHAQDFAPVVKLRLDSDELLSELANLPGLANEGLTVKVSLDATDIADQVAALKTPIEPVVKLDVDEANKDLVDLADNAPAIPMTAVIDPIAAERAADTFKTNLPDIAIPLGLDEKPAEEAGRRVENRLTGLKPIVTPVANTVPLESDVDRVVKRLADTRLSLGLSTDPAEALATARKAIDKIGALKAIFKIEPDDDDVTRQVKKLAETRIKLGLDIDPTEALATARKLIEDLQQNGPHVQIAVDPLEPPEPPDFGPLEEEFEQAGEESGTRFGAGLKRALSGLASLVGVASGAFLATALVKGFDRLNTIEDATASLTVQLGSATEAAELLDKVLGVVRGTPFNLDQFAKAAADMVSFGVETKKIPGYLTAIGEAAASQGGRANEVAQRLSLIFGQITTANRIGGQELLQFSEAGVNALAILGNAFGKTTTEIRDMISQGAVPAKKALDILSEGILHGSTGIAGTTVAFAGTMAKLRETLTGSIGGFSAATARLGVELIEPFKDGLVAAFQGATTAIDNFGAKIHKAFANIAASGLGRQLIDDLKNLPDLVERISHGLGQLGPALAPLAGFIGASGLGSLKELLGSLGSFIPALTPIKAAIAAFVVFTPEIRDELFPVLLKLAGIVVEVGAVVGDAAGKIGTSLVPVFIKLAHVAESMVPLVETAVGLGEALAQVLVPAIGALSAVITHIPIPVIEALVVAFVALKAATAFSGVGDRFGTFVGNKIFQASQLRDELANTSKAAVRSGVAISGAFAGMALASEDSATRITGAVTAIGTVALGFAAGGPIGGALALAGTAVGVITGHFLNQAREAAALRHHIDDLAGAYTKQTLELIKDNDALTRWLSLSAEARGNSSLGQLFLDDSDKGKQLAQSLHDVGLASAGLAGDQQLGSIIVGLRTYKDDVTKVPQLNEALLRSFGDFGPIISGLVSKYGSVEKAVENVNRAQKELALNASSAQPLAPADTGLDPALIEAVDFLNGKKLELTDGQTVIAKALQDFVDLAKDPANDPTKFLQESLNQQINQVPKIAAAFDLISKAQGGLTVNTLEYADALKLEQRIQSVIGGQDAEITQGMLRRQEITKALTSATITLGDTQVQVTGEMIDMWQRLANEFGVDILQVVPTELKPFVQDILDADEAAKGLVETEKDIEPPLTAAELAAKEFAAAIALSADAARQVGVEIDKLKAKLSDRIGIQNFIGDLRDVSVGFGKIINAADVKAGESLNKSIADSADRIQQLQLDVNKEADDAAARSIDLKDRIERARAAGAVGGAARLEFELAHVDDKTKKKQAELDKALADLNDKRGQLGKAGAAPITALEQLLAQAKERGLTLFDLLLSAPTEEAKAAFQGLIAPVIQDATDQFIAEATKHPENAANLAIFYKQVILNALTEGGLDPETAQKIVDQFFGVEQVGNAIAVAARAHVAELHAELKKAILEDPSLGQIAMSIKDVPPADRQAQIDKLNEEFKKYSISVGLEPRDLNAEEIAQLQGLAVTVDAAFKIAEATFEVGTINIIVDGESHAGLAGVVESTHKDAQKEMDKLPPIVMKAEGHELTDGEAAGLKERWQTAIDSSGDVTVNVSPTFKPQQMTKDFSDFLTSIGIRLPVPVVLAPSTSTIADLGKKGVVQKEGGIIRFAGSGTAGTESHFADIVSAGTYRVFAEHETHGEGYVPLSPFKRTRSTQIVAAIADLFGLALVPKPKAPAVARSREDVTTRSEFARSHLTDTARSEFDHSQQTDVTRSFLTDVVRSHVTEIVRSRITDARSHLAEILRVSTKDAAPSAPTWNVVIQPWSRTADVVGPAPPPERQLTPAARRSHVMDSLAEAFEMELAPGTRTRSGARVVDSIAGVFGVELAPKAKMPMPSVMTGGRSLSPDDADMIGAAVARHTRPTHAERADEFARRYAEGVHFEQGAIVVQASPTSRRTASALVSRLADLAFKH